MAPHPDHPMHADRNAGPRIDEDARPAIRVGQDPRSAVQRSEARDTAEPEGSPNGVFAWLPPWDHLRADAEPYGRSIMEEQASVRAKSLTLRARLDALAHSRAPHPDSETNPAVTKGSA